jgi:hypothetical protein
MDLAHGRVFYRNRLLHHHHGRLGKIQPEIRGAACLVSIPPAVTGFSYRG